MLNIRNSTTIEVRKIVYISLFQGKMAYGLLLWGSSVYTKDILLIQKRIVRIMCFKSRLESCRNIFRELRILTVISLYVYQSLLFVKKNLSLYK